MRRRRKRRIERRRDRERIRMGVERKESIWENHFERVETRKTK